jgi:hypothetical protein
LNFFLDPEKPLETCQENSCDDCNVKEELNCHFNSNQLIRFFLIGLPVMLVGVVGIYVYSPLFIIPWLVTSLLYFGFIEIRVMCSHCPHYAETEGKTLKCWANYGSPKLWKYRPGPMSRTEKIVFILGILIIFVYPILFMILSRNYAITILYLILSLMFFYLMRKVMCSQCINFACPSNIVDKKIQQKFFKHNPRIREAWEK